MSKAPADFTNTDDVLYMNYLKKQGVITKRELGVYFTDYANGNHMYFGGYDTSVVQGEFTWAPLMSRKAYTHWDLVGGPVNYDGNTLDGALEISYATLDTGSTLAYFPTDTFNQLLKIINGEVSDGGDGGSGGGDPPPCTHPNPKKCKRNLPPKGKGGGKGGGGDGGGTTTGNGLNCTTSSTSGWTTCPGCTGRDDPRFKPIELSLGG